MKKDIHFGGVKKVLFGPIYMILSKNTFFLKISVFSQLFRKFYQKNVIFRKIAIFGKFMIIGKNTIFVKKVNFLNILGFWGW